MGPLEVSSLPKWQLRVGARGPPVWPYGSLPAPSCQLCVTVARGLQLPDGLPKTRAGAVDNGGCTQAWDTASVSDRPWNRVGPPRVSDDLLR